VTGEAEEPVSIFRQDSRVDAQAREGVKRLIGEEDGRARLRRRRRSWVGAGGWSWTGKRAWWVDRDDPDGARGFEGLPTLPRHAGVGAEWALQFCRCAVVEHDDFAVQVEAREIVDVFGRKA